MHRREFLALSAASTTGLTGCLSGASAPSPESDATTTDAATTTTDRTIRTTDATETTTQTTIDATVSVTDVTLQPGVVTLVSADHISVGRQDGQYLFVDVTAEGSALPSRDDFAFRFGGTTYPAVSTAQPWRIWRYYGDRDWLYDAGSGEGVLLFELPESADSSTEASLTWPGSEWRPDDALWRRLATPEPSLTVSVDIPETVPASEYPTVSLTVKNEGDVTGQFLGALNRAGPRVAHVPVTTISFLVPAGESKTWKLTDDSIMDGESQEENVGDGEPDMTYYLDWSGDSVERNVRYTD